MQLAPSVPPASPAVVPVARVNKQGRSTKALCTVPSRTEPTLTRSVAFFVKFSDNCQYKNFSPLRLFWLKTQHKWV